VLSGCEVAKDKPEEWVFEAYLPRKPRKADKDAILALLSMPSPN
jgi:ribosomal protein L11 methyltransferase